MQVNTSGQTKRSQSAFAIPPCGGTAAFPLTFTKKFSILIFTTKPARQGAGMGLAISHDIIVQQHKGEIKVETEDGKFTEFVISLPKA
jgi:light-regulated signal transduction histidine kinase (bacteriophytochrome)